MFLYIDDDSVDRVLIQRLTDSGYKTLTPSLAGTAGQADPVHFMCAIRAGSVVLTRDYDDFKLLHDLVLLAGGHHPGILVVRRDNDPKRDMSPRAIVRAIQNLTPRTWQLLTHFTSSTSGAEADRLQPAIRSSRRHLTHPAVDAPVTCS